MTTKPTYEELANTVLIFDTTLRNLYGVLGRHPKAESGNSVDLLLLLQPLWGVDGIVDNLKEEYSTEAAKQFVEECRDYRKSSQPLTVMPVEKQPTLQQYLQDSDDQGYNMKDMLLQHFVDAERRRMSKSGEDETGRSLYYEVEQDINNLQIPLVDVLQAVFHVFERAAKGDTTSE